MYAASLRKDSAYDGLFFMAVKTTGIFCKASCTARKPKFSNVEFFFSVSEAAEKGYRPCKVCKPLDTGDKPGFVIDVLQRLHNAPDVRIKDWDLRQMSIEPATLRRWFQKHHNMSFHAYQRLLRLNRAFGQIKSGRGITDAAYGSGYESLSGFGEAYKKATGAAPKHSKQKTVITTKTWDGPLGRMIMGATNEGICLFDFAERRMLATIMKRIEKGLNGAMMPGEHPYFAELERQITEYFTGARQTFDLPLHLVGTNFQKQVWEELMRIPYGTSRSYKQQSIALNNEKAVRAVAGANGENGIAIIIPCHRVIGENGHLTGYGGGLWRKKWLLEHEAKHSGRDMQVPLFAD